MSEQYASLPPPSSNHLLLEDNEYDKRPSRLLELNTSEQEGSKAAEHETINVTDRADGDNKDDCSDLTDHNNNNQETEDQSRTFPQKLRDMLLNEEHQGIISFLDHGRGFMIYKKRLFEAEVLPKYFKKSKFTSFTRKLNRYVSTDPGQMFRTFFSLGDYRWGFTRVSRGPEMGAYFHKLFLRDKPELIYQMTSNSRGRARPLMYPSAILPNPQGLMAGSSTFNLLAQNPMAPNNAMAGIQAPNLAGLPGLFPANGTVTMTAQQQALWQQQMQFMQFQMLQMQQQQQAMQAALFQQQQQQQPPQQQQAQQPQASTDPGGVAASMFHQSIPLMVPMMTMAGAIGAPATGAAQTAVSAAAGAGTLAASGAAPGPPPSAGECGAAAALPPAPGDGDASATSYHDVPV